MKWDGDVVISVRSTKIVNATAVKTSGCATVTTLANCIRIEAEGGVTSNTNIPQDKRHSNPLTPSLVTVIFVAVRILGHLHGKKGIVR